MPVVTDISSFESVPVVEKEVFHYLGVPESKLVDFDAFKKTENELCQKVNCAIAEMKPLLLPKAVYSTYKLDSTFTVPIGGSFDAPGKAIKAGASVTAPETEQKAGIAFGAFDITSNDLVKNLSGCKTVTVFAATIGVQVDILIRKYTKLDVGYAAVLQAVGAMFVESYVECLINRFEADAAKDNLRLRPRFSPGYGDLSLTVQKDIFTALTPEKIGLSLMESLIMAPEKSVTAFVGAC